MEYKVLARLAHNNKQVGIAIIDKNNDDSWDYPFERTLDNPNVVKVSNNEIPSLVSNCVLYHNRNGLVFRTRFRAGKPCLSDLPVLKHKPKVITRSGEYENIPIRLQTVFVYKASIRGQKISADIGYEFLNASEYNILIGARDVIIGPGGKLWVARDRKFTMVMESLQIEYGWGNELIVLENAVIERGDTRPIVRGLSNNIEIQNICVVNSSKIKQKYLMFTGAVQERLKLMSI